MFATLLAAALVSAFVESGDARVRCYEELGCIDTGGVFFHPVHRSVNFLPTSRNVVNAQFFLYVREDPGCTKLSWKSTLDDVRHSPFNASKETKIIVHGFLDTLFFGAWMTDMKDAYLRHNDLNVIIVDWTGGNTGLYEWAVANTRVVGAEIALLIWKLQETFDLDPRTVHIVGHSLGAHIAGYVGQNTTNLGRITAMDPAEPYFENMPAAVRVDRSDAEFVDVIHTDSHPLLKKLWKSEGLGMQEAVGHIDFYPNGGQYMPGCGLGSRVYKILSHGVIKGVRDIVSCNHQRVVKYMIDSIENSLCLPMAFECSSYEAYLKGECSDCGKDGSKCAPMGEHAVQWKRFKDDHRARIMYGTTNAHKPFCALQYLVMVSIGVYPGHARAEGNIFLAVTRSNHRQTFQVNHRHAPFHPNKTYSFVTTSPVKISKFHKLEFQYRCTLFFGSVNLPVVDVRIQPMTHVVTESAAEALTYKLCPPKKSGGVYSYDYVALEHC